MMYYIDLRKFRKENNRIKQLKQSKFICINDIAAEQQVPLDKQMWRLFFRNPQLTGLCICFDRWNNRVRDYSIYCVTHGIQAGIIDLTFDTTLKFMPISNLMRNEFANRQLLIQAYDEIWNETNKKLDRHAKPDKKPYLLKQMRDDNLAYFRIQREEAEFLEQLRAIAKIGDEVDIKAVQRVLPAFAFAYELDDTIRQLPARKQEYIGTILPHFEGYYEFANACLMSEHDTLATLSQEVWERIPTNPVASRKHLINFGVAWASRYELAYPANDDQAIFTACEVLFYMQCGIEPCRDLHVEDLVSYESMHIDNHDDEVALNG